MLAAIGVLHVSWAAGSHWPAPSETRLADAVIGGSVAPSRGPTAVVGASLIGAAAVAGVCRSTPGGAARAALGVALVTRAIVGGVLPARALGVANPSPTFRRWDRRVYRPLCASLGILFLFGLLAVGGSGSTRKHPSGGARRGGS